MPEPTAGVIHRIEIEHRRGESPPFEATLSFNGQGRFPLQLTPPFDEKKERELQWYFEEHLRFPQLDRQRAAAAADSLTDYGHQLFQQLFQDPRAFARYLPLREDGASRLRVEVIGPPAFHNAFHWEALKDPDLSAPLALEAQVVRRHVQDTGQAARVIPSALLRVLVITARPWGRRDVGYRTITRPLLEMLENNPQARIVIEQVRPGTWPALLQHLEDTRQRHGEGYYHILHFDLHGSVLGQEVLQEKLRSGAWATPLAFDTPGEHPEFKGRQAFLFFETDQDGQAEAVPAKALAQELQKHQIPLVVLNACQSGQPTRGEEDRTESSLGARLVEAGALGVIAMRYSVTVSAARLLMGTFYGQLAQGADPLVALRRGRQELKSLF